MTATRLTIKRVEKPWGRRDLWPAFESVPEGGKPVGEIWFEVPGKEDSTADGPLLLVKYLFTSDRLSVQVHPNDEAARAAGYPRGKSESWVVLAADPHATIGLGMKTTISHERLREAAEDGSIVELMDWKSVKKDDFYYTPAGTVHAIGPGLTVVEIQQNVDLTYRLYDYGSDRELHLDAGIPVCNPVPYVAPSVPYELSPGREILCEGPAFAIERWTGEAKSSLQSGDRPLWLVPLSGGGTIDGQAFEAGTCWLVEGGAEVSVGADSDLLVAYPGQGIESGLRV